MAKPCKKFKYKEKGTNQPVINPKKIRRKKRYDTITGWGPEYPQHKEYFGEIEYDKTDYLAVTGEKNAIEELRKWVMTQRYIPHDLSDEFLTLFLLNVNFDTKNACERIKKYFFSRQEPSSLFQNRDPFCDENDNILEKLYVVPMPGITKMGKKIIITGLCRPLMSYSLLAHAKALSLVLDLLIWENDFGYGDFVVILNGNGFTCPQLLQNEVHNHRSITSLLLDTIPGTLRAFYLVSPPPHVVNLAKSRNGISIIVVNNPKKMSDHLGPNNLPQEYGGSLNSFGEIKETWFKHMQDSRKLWISFDKRMTDYYKRRLCHEEDIRSGGKHWVQNMKLVADEWEYKTEYYGKMRNMEILKHPAYGSERLLNMKKNHKHVSPPTGIEILKKEIKEERNLETFFEISYLNNGYASKIQKAKLEVENEERKKFLNRLTSCRPILELEIRY